MATLARRFSRFVAVIGLLILATSAGIWLYTQTEGFTQPIGYVKPVTTPTIPIFQPTPTVTPTTPPGQPTNTPAPIITPSVSPTGQPTATSASGLGGFADPNQANGCLLGIIVLLLLLLVILLLLFASRNRRQNEAVVVGNVAPVAQNQAISAQGQDRAGVVWNLVLAVISTIAGAIISHFWR